MVFEKIENNKVWTPKKEGDFIEGVLISKEPSEKYPDNFVYNLEVKDENGEIIEKKVYGSSILNNIMDVVNLGSYIKIVYIGTKPSKKGADTKVFEVYIDK
jgi:hypothetical protein